MEQKAEEFSDGGRDSRRADKDSGRGYGRKMLFGLVWITLLASLPLFSVQWPVLWKDRLILFLCNGGTCLVSFGCFGGMFHSGRAGLLCAGLYTLSIYRLYALYGRWAFGEAVSMLFLPIVLYSFYRIYSEENTKQWRAWVLLVLAMSGALQFHDLYGILTGGVLAVVALVLWRKTFRGLRPVGWLAALAAIGGANFRVLRDSFRTIRDAAVAGLGQAAGQVMEQTAGQVTAQDTIQEKGLYPAQLLFTFFEKGSSRNYVQNGLSEVEAVGIGMAFVLVLAAFLFLWLGNAEEPENKREVRMGKIASVTALAAMIMSLSLFPWNLLQAEIPLFSGITAYLESPEYLLVIAVTALTVAAGATAQWLRAIGKKQLCKGYMLVTGFTAAGTAFFYLVSLINNV